MNPRWPVFVPSKSRAHAPWTSKALDAIGVAHKVVVQPQQAKEYAEAVGCDKLLLLPDGLDGLVPTRNWIWDLAAETGVKRFWTFDDNIKGFYRLNRNLKTPVTSGTMLACVEEWVERYENVTVAGCQYHMFASRKTSMPPVYLNTRVYSNMLILTDARDPQGQPYRNVGVYNDDTDLCLRMLKDGWCTALFNAFLIFKLTTMTVKGGMTPQYEGDGRLKMAQELQAAHPDVTDITWKWGRWQHSVDYRPFAGNKLIPKPGVVVPRGVDNHGMVLQDLIDGRWVSRDETRDEAARREARAVLEEMDGLAAPRSSGPGGMIGDEL